MGRKVDSAYQDDLAYIHDAGFGHVAAAAARSLVEILRKAQHAAGLVVELGCGSGILSAAVVDAGYDALGYDLSPAMVELARQRVPTGEFRAESFLDAELPRCVAVTAVGEVFNYLFDARNAANRLPATFKKIFRALGPGGMLLFDMATPGRIPGGLQRNLHPRR